MTWLYSPSRRFRYSPQTREFQEFAGAWFTHPPVPKHWSLPDSRSPCGER